MHYIGIDPGANGGIAILDEARDVKALQKIHALTEQELWDFLFDWSFFPSIVCIEQVHSYPGQGVSSTFTFGENFGMLRGLLVASRLTYHRVAPQKWQGSVGYKSKAGSKTDRKKRLRQLAQQHFPTATIHADTADALLIAEYCWNTYHK